MTSCLNPSPSLTTFTRCQTAILKVKSPQEKDCTAHTHSRPYVRTIETFESGFAIQLGHTIASTVGKASSAQNCNAAFPKGPSCSNTSPRLLVQMLLTPPVDLVITTTLADAMCSGSRGYEQAHLDQYLEHAHICYTSTLAHANHAASFRRTE